MDSLVQADKSFFLLLNGMHSPFWDSIMVFCSGKISWIPLYLVFIYFLIRERKKNVYITLLAIVVLILATDQISVLIKDSVMRLRPCHDLTLGAMVHVVTGCGGKYGFVSSHAANTFGIAMFLGLFFQKKWVWAGLLIWASMVSYSRIYLGVHFPADVLGGALIGLLVGWGMYHLERFVISKVSDSSAN